MRETFHNERTIAWGGLMALQLGVGLLWLPFYRFNVLADAISYTVWARHWVAMESEFLVNAYWSPLTTWLLLPAAATGNWQLESLWFKLMGLLAGWIAIRAADRLALRLGLAKRWRWALAIGWVLAFTHWAMLLFLADILSAAMVLWVLVWVLHRSYTISTRIAIYAGVFGALAYYAKAYNGVFFLALTGLYVAAGVRFPKIRYYRRSIGISIVVLLLLVAPWAIAVSIKEKHVSLGSTGTYNLQLLHCFYNKQSHDRLGLMPPPASQHAVSAWDEITTNPLVQAELQQPCSSVEGTVWALELNIRRFGLNLLNRGWVLLLVPIVIALFRRRHMLINNNMTIAVGSMGALYTAGYFLTVMDDRYLGPTWVMLVLIAAYCCSHLWARQRTLLRVLPVAIAALMAAWPLYELHRWRYDSRPDAAFAAWCTATIPNLAYQPIAAWPGMGWHYCEEFAYRTHTLSWGTPPKSVTDAVAVQQLCHAPARFVLVRADTFPALDTLAWPVHSHNGFRLYDTGQ
jgi:hypothetical protein